MALRVAKTVQRTKVNATLDPMPNDERKAALTLESSPPDKPINHLNRELKICLSHSLIANNSASNSLFTHGVVNEDSSKSIILHSSLNESLQFVINLPSL